MKSKEPSNDGLENVANFLQHVERSFHVLALRLPNLYFVAWEFWLLQNFQGIFRLFQLPIKFILYTSKRFIQMLPVFSNTSGSKNQKIEQISAEVFYFQVPKTVTFLHSRVGLEIQPLETITKIQSWWEKNALKKVENDSCFCFLLFSFDRRFPKNVKTYSTQELNLLVLFVITFFGKRLSQKENKRKQKQLSFSTFFVFHAILHVHYFSMDGPNVTQGQIACNLEREHLSAQGELCWTCIIWIRVVVILDWNYKLILWDWCIMQNIYVNNRKKDCLNNP